MKKSVKITLWVCGSLAVLVFVLFLSADIIASRFVQQEVRKAFDKIPNADATIGGVYLNFISGSALVTDITFCTNSLSLEDSLSGERAPGIAVHIPSITVWNVHYADLLRNHRCCISSVTIDEPQLLVYLDEKHPEAILPFIPEDTMVEKAGQWLEAVELQSLEINHLSARLSSTNSPLYVSVDSLSIGLPTMAYNLSDSLFSYNDSVYRLALRALHVETPDGFFAIEARDIETEDQGPISMGYAHVWNVISAKQMADLVRGHVSWIDLELNGLTTSAFNPIRKALGEDYTLESIQADVKRMHVITDQRHQPKEPFGTPQEFLRKLPVTFGIKTVDAVVRRMDVELATTDINRGELHLKNMRGHMTNVTNRKGAIWRSQASGPFGAQGKMNATFTMHMDKASTFDLALEATDVDTETLNPFVRPLVGITSRCHIDRLEAQYTGDRNGAQGEFCMQYHGLDVQVHKEDKIPYEIVTKNAELFTSMANTLVPKSNPTVVDPAPRRYYVEWKRDVWKPYPLYIFGPCIDGIKKTMLPGLYVHKQVKK